MQSEDSAAFFLASTAGDGSRLVDSRLLGGGRAAKALVLIMGGKHHEIRGNTLRNAAGIAPIKIDPASLARVGNNPLVEK